MASMWADIQSADHNRRLKAAKAEPAANKLTKVFDPDARMSYRYYDGGKDGRGRKVWFCWATERNAAGYFLGWREVRGKTGGKRDQWVARKVKARCKEAAKRRADVFKAKRAVQS